MKEPKRGEFYRHFKGTAYQILDVATHSETGERLVIYRSQKTVWARPLLMFMESVEVDGKTVPRFRRMNI